jgi:predicted P-loop ATPase
MRDLAKSLDGYAYFMHQTHRGNGYRLVMPLAEEVPHDDWRGVWGGIADKFKLPKDATCVNESRLYYCPTRPVGSEFACYEGEGQALAWREIDPVFPAGIESAVAALTGTIVATLDPADPRNLRPAGDVDLEELRRAVASMRRAESRAVLDTILSGRKLAEPGFRDTALNQACSLLATAPQGKPYPAETVVALLHGSIQAMDCEPEGLDHWLEEARKKYLRACARRLEKDAHTDAEQAELMRVLGVEPGKVVEGTSEEWRRGLIYTLNQNGEPGGLRVIGANANLIMRNDVNWKGFLRFNEITREIDITGGCLLGKPKATLDTEAANWLARSEYKLYLGSREAGEQMIAIARECSYDPLRDWLEGLSWDGVDRVTNFFADYFGAVGDAEHLRAVSKCFLISCIARAMEPGCEVHTVPILVGGQGVGKSRSVKALGQPYFTDTGLNIGDKDSRMLIASKWIVELAELASVREMNIEKVKNFVTIAADDFRPPYGRVMESFKRRCVFVGTTNEDEVLTDWTGQRRWWPIRVSKADVNRIRADRDQILAQALVMYRAGEHWYLTDEEAARAEQQASGFKRSSARGEQILAWFAAKEPRERPSELTVFELLNNVLGVPSSNISTQQSMDVGHAARELGFTKHRKSQGGRLVWVYRTPKAIMEMPRDAKPSSVEPVPDKETG